MATMSPAIDAAARKAAASEPLEPELVARRALEHIDHLVVAFGAVNIEDDASDAERSGPTGPAADPPAAAAAAGPAPVHAQAPAVQTADSAHPKFVQLPTPLTTTPPPYWASEEELAALASAAEAAGAPEALAAEEGRERLARLLADPRILATPLFGTFCGRQRLHAIFAGLRAFSRDASGTRLVWAIVRSLLEALLQPPPAADEGPSPFREADVGRLIDLATAFVETCTSWSSRIDWDLFLLQPPLADRLALCAADLALPFADRPGPIHARALMLRANIHRVFDRAGPAIELYYEAWSDLRRKALTPSDEEANIIRRLAMLLYETQQLRTAHYVSGSAYLPPGATGEERMVEEYHLAYLNVVSLRWRNEFALAERYGRRCLEIAEKLGPPSSHVLRIRVLMDLITISNHRLQPRGIWGYGRMASEDCMALHDPSAAELDMLSCLRTVRRYVRRPAPPPARPARPAPPCPLRA
eukprot:tig00020801_g13928.t1